MIQIFYIWCSFSFFLMLAIIIVGIFVLYNQYWDELISVVKNEFSKLISLGFLFSFIFFLAFTIHEEFFTGMMTNISAGIWLFIVGWLSWETLKEKQFNNAKKALVVLISQSTSSILNILLIYLYSSFFYEHLSEEEKDNQLRVTAEAVMKKRKADPTFDAIKNQKSQLLQKIAESKLLLYELNANPEGLQFNLRKWIENLDNAKELSKKLSKFSDDLRDLLVIHQGFLYDDAVRRRNFTFLSLLIQLYNSVKELSEHLAVPEYIWMQRYFLRVYPDRFILQPVISEMLTIVDDVIGELEEWQQ